MRDRARGLEAVSTRQISGRPEVVNSEPWGGSSVFSPGIGIPGSRVLAALYFKFGRQMADFFF